MTRGGALTFLGLLACGACSALNPPEQRLPERNPCDGGSCESDPCEKCDARATCEAGTCRCPPELLDVGGDGARCEPKPKTEQDPESELGPDPGCRNDADCDAHEQCAAGEGGTACRCAPGYERVDGSCVDADECAQADLCGDNTRCVDYEGSHECVCEPGYGRADPDARCEDIDECAAEAEPCGSHAICENLPGSYDCSCEPGYAGDARNGCSDSHQCASGELACSEHATCEPQPGPDRCVCDPYYSDVLGDGTECRDDRIEWSMWTSSEMNVSVAPAAVSGGSESDELIAVVTRGPNGLSLCGNVFDTPGPTETMVVAVLDGSGACRWARRFDVSVGEVLSQTVDADGSVALAMALFDVATVDGQSIGTPAQRSEYVLRFAPGGALAWALPVPCRSTLYDQIPAIYPTTGPLGSSEAGDVYVLVRYDGTCTIGGHELPPATRDNVAILKLARADGSALWGRAVVHGASGTVTFKDLAVAADGNVYIVGDGAPADFGRGLWFGGGGFVFALDRDGANRWLQTVPGATTISAGTPGRVRIVTFAYEQEEMPSSHPNAPKPYSFDLVELDAADGQERWVKRLVSRGYWSGSLGSDTLGRTVYSSIVWDDATVGGELVPPSVKGNWASLIALDPERRVMWTRTLLPQGVSDFGFLRTELTPSGKLFVAGHCKEECGLAVSSDSERHFLVRMRL